MKIAICECDPRSAHTVFNNLSDRFYEALSNKTVTLFDQSCINTLKNSELKDCNYQNFIINSLDNLNKRDYKKEWEEQSKWIQVVENEQKRTINALKTFY